MECTMNVNIRDRFWMVKDEEGKNTDKISKIPFDWSWKVTPFEIKFGTFNIESGSVNIEGWHNKADADAEKDMQRNLQLPSWVTESLRMAFNEYREAIYEGVKFEIVISDCGPYQVKGLDLNPEAIAWRAKLRAAKAARSLANAAYVTAKVAAVKDPNAEAKEAKEQARARRLAKIQQ